MVPLSFKRVFFLFLQALLLFSCSTSAVADLIGSTACFACHDAEEARWPKNPHAATKNGCEDCHGPGGAHQETMDKKEIINPGKIAGERQIALCGRCHFKPEGFSRKLWEDGTHAQSGIYCLNCHAPHQSNQAKLLTKSRVNSVCYSCHTDQKKSFEKGPHGLNGLRCPDCHSPHGSTQANLLRADSRRVCQSCHSQEPHHFIADRAGLQLKSLECVSCHALHLNKQYFLKFKKEELCVLCHKNIY